MMKKKKVIAAFLAALCLSAMTACASEPAASTADYIGIDNAKQAALQAAGISADNVSFSSAGLDSRDGIFYYQVIFSSNGTEWEYDVDALTGVIIEEKVLSSNDMAAEAGEEPAPSAAPEETAPSSAASNENQSASVPVSQPASVPSSQPVPGTAGQNALSGGVDSSSALSIALAHAGLTEEELAFSKVEPDFDDGISIFEVEFLSKDGVEYDYELDARDGSIISFDQDAELFLPPSSSSAGMVSEDQAKEAVLARVPGANAADISLHLRQDDGRMEYSGRLLYDNMLYEFKVDAYSGNLIEWEAERY